MVFGGRGFLFCHPASFNPIDLENIAKATNGEMLVAASSSELEELYKEISRKIRNQYRVSYTSLWPNTENINVEIMVEESELSGIGRTEYHNPFYAPPPTGVVVERVSPFLSWFKIWWVKLIIYAAIFLGAVLFLYRTEKRLQKFNVQLPKTLQLISGSLKAGYSFNQSLSMVVEETDAPISYEFKRVLSEMRTGLPEREALENLLKRIDSEHLRWVVMEVNIQREVGGNLVEVLETISKTIRERDAALRQIKALTAERRLSAIILIALPILVGVFITITNREYISLLITNPLGLVMIGVSSVLMVIGIIWIVKIVRVEY